MAPAKKLFSTRDELAEKVFFFFQKDIKAQSMMNIETTKFLTLGKNKIFLWKKVSFQWAVTLQKSNSEFWIM